MTLKYSILAEERIVEVAAGMTDSFDGFIDGMIRLVKDPAFVAEYHIIADFREARYHPSFADIRAMGAAFIPFRSAFRGKVAFVIKDRLQLKLGRFAALLAKLLHFEIAVFEQPAEADEWLHRRKDRNVINLKNRIIALLAKPRLCCLATMTPEGAPWVRYITARSDDALVIRFATVKESRKVVHIAQNPKVHLVTGVEDPATALSWAQIEGLCEITDDPAEKTAYWNDGLRAYFNGPTDPSYMIGIIKPYRIELMGMGIMKADVWQG